MARKPSERRSFRQEAMELNLTPMMNLIAILIPCLLVSVAFVEIAVVKVAAPGDEPADTPPPDRVPLGLALAITDEGFSLTTAARVFDDAGPDGVTIPVVERAVSCERYLGTVPPPRSRNRVAPCAEAAEVRKFTVFDLPALRARLLVAKDRFPDEHLIIISAAPRLEFEAVVDAMDVSREAEVEGVPRPLFEEVVFRPAAR